jgi:hypothetical protein
VKGKESNGSDGNKSERASVSESIIQKLHMRPLLAMCTSLGVTLHDGRNKPHLYLIADGMTLSGKLDIIFCKDGKVLGGGEFKVAFNSNNYSGQIYSSTFGLAAGINQNWNLDELYGSNKATYHPFNIFTNGEHTMRFMTSPKYREMQADDSSSVGLQSLQRIYNILCHAIEDARTLNMGGLSLDSGEDDELGGGGDEGGGRDYFEGGDVDRTDDDVGDVDRNNGEGGASCVISERGHLESSSLNMLNLMEHNIRMDGVAFLRGMRPNFLHLNPDSDVNQPTLLSPEPWVLG